MRDLRRADRDADAETHPQKPINAYGETKLAIERALPHLERAHGLRWVALRYFNAAGADPDGELGEDHSPEIHIVPRAIAASGGTAGLQVFGDDYPTPDGTCLRDYVHVTDLADAHVRALEAMVETGRSNVQPGHGPSPFGAGSDRRGRAGDGPPGAVDARAAAAGRSGRALRGAAQGAGGAALDTTISGPRIDRPHGLGVAPDAPARIRHMTRAGTGAIVNPLLSVVMPAYNERDTIDEIVRRVLAVPLRIELIVVDDAVDGRDADLLQALQRSWGSR